MSKRSRKPIIPGVILREEFMASRGLTVSAFARELGISRKHLSGIVNGKARLTPQVAARLAHRLDTSTALWVNLQAAVDSWDAEQEYRRGRRAA
jgi:addiction module HigA family antidote